MCRIRKLLVPGLLLVMCFIQTGWSEARQDYKHCNEEDIIDHGFKICANIEKVHETCTKIAIAKEEPVPSDFCDLPLHTPLRKQCAACGLSHSKPLKHED